MQVFDFFTCDMSCDTRVQVCTCCLEKGTNKMDWLSFHKIYNHNKKKMVHFISFNFIFGSHVTQFYCNKTCSV